MAPTVSLDPWPSTSATAIQSLADPSVNANASTSSPTSSVRGSRHACSTPEPFVSCSGAGAVRGRKRRVDQTISSGDSTAIAPTCAAIGIAAAAVAVPMPAPATVPRLNAACSRGISERPSRRSTSAPSTFIDTSQTPMPNPTSTSPAAAGATAPPAEAQRREPEADPERDGAPEHPEAGAEPVHDRPGQREARDGPGRHAEQEQAELRGRQAQRLAHGRGARGERRERDAARRERDDDGGAGAQQALIGADGGHHDSNRIDSMLG